MSGNPPKRNRAKRVAPLKLPPRTYEKAIGTIQRTDVLMRLGLCLLTAIFVWIATGGWYPPFSFRVAHVPARNIVARVTFERVDKQATIDSQNAARRIIDCVYMNDPRPLRELQQALKDKIFQLRAANSYDDVDKALWAEFVSAENEPDQQVLTDADGLTALALGSIQASGNAVPPYAPGTPQSRQWRRRAEFARFKQAFADDPDLAQFAAAVSRSLAEFTDHGLLESLQHNLDQGNQSRIRVYSAGNESYLRSFEVDHVRIGQAVQRLEANLKQQLASPEFAAKIFAWMKPKLPTTLTFNSELTRTLADREIKNMPPVMVTFTANESVLAHAGEPLTPEDLELLRVEHAQYISQLGIPRLIYYTLANFGMYTAVYTLCGFYIFFRYRPLLNDLISLGKLLLWVLVTIGVAYHVAGARFESIPLLLFAMTVVILYRQELALLLSASVALVTVLSLDQGIVQFVTLLAGMSTTVLLLRHLRSRTKLIYVALWAALVMLLTSIGSGILAGGSPGWQMLQEAVWLAGCAIAAGLLMTGLLPFIERFFDVQTDLSLLELGDVAHPLLQELVRRAPGTYNHSINVASIGQAAAESIGANGLLVRVGAYFHDIGKMLKPGYFVENQGGAENCHESLLPAMSTLVIIAHVKDGADLARQHNLPNTIIDFIQQHHGTTLVEYFYRRANEQQEADPGGGKVDEGSFRYPGPKPQTREAAVLMLADTVESAARSLVDPAPARIESLVEELAMRKLLDGQFDECNLTLRELRTIQDSLIKSLTAVYHGRIKYPGQQSA
jgi:putative nucleotidyltransferase with HDIG domain